MGVLALTFLLSLSVLFGAGAYDHYFAFSRHLERTGIREVVEAWFEESVQRYMIQDSNSTRALETACTRFDSVTGWTCQRIGLDYVFVMDNETVRLSKSDVDRLLARVESRLE